MLHQFLIKLIELNKYTLVFHLQREKRYVFSPEKMRHTAHWSANWTVYNLRDCGRLKNHKLNEKVPFPWFIWVSIVHVMAHNLAYCLSFLSSKEWHMKNGKNDFTFFAQRTTWKLFDDDTSNNTHSGIPAQHDKCKNCTEVLLVFYTFNSFFLP